MNETQITPSDIALATLALSLVDRPTDGKAPSEEELQALRLGRLAEPRRSEVIACLGRDPLAFERLREQEAATAWLTRLEAALAAEHTQAALALGIGSEPAAAGAVPDLVDIELWRQGRLNPQRRAEVLDHLAREAASFARLSELEGAEPYRLALERAEERERQPGATPLASVTSIETRRTRKRPGWIWGGGLTALAAALLLFTLIPMLKPLELGLDIDAGYARIDSAYRPPLADWTWSPGGWTKSFEPWLVTQSPTPTPDIRQESFRFGVGEGLRRLVDLDSLGWTAVLEALPSALPSCAGADTACAEAQPLYRETGRWAVLLYWQCRRSDVDSGFWVDQERLRGRLAQRFAELGEATSLVEALAVDPGKVPREELCRSVETLLAAGFNEPET